MSAVQGAVQEIEGAIGRAAERSGTAVVGIGGGWRGGSGVVVAPGFVLTAAHNLSDRETTVRFVDGRRADAAVAGADPDRDLVVLAVDTGETASIEPLAESADPAIGTAVIALANPGGRGLRATLGFVSATERSFRGPRGRRVTGCIEHTASLPRGSSGSPLLSSDGGLLGLNAIRLEGGLIVALPVERSSVEALQRGERSERVRLGVAVAPPYVARRLRRAVGLPDEPGVLVRAVESDSAADRGGIEQGDLIVACGERRIDSVDALYRALDGVGREGSLELSLLRGSDRRAASVEFRAEDKEVAR